MTLWIPDVYIKAWNFAADAHRPLPTAHWTHWYSATTGTQPLTEYQWWLQPIRRGVILLRFVNEW
ncbi:hypothetical protein N836_12820 [Leptolyngbya sp. Heron Island J]|uniref:hypothetical protein n=1 Tax=Leptolyngbya sp. Heron Island J TaxID=1385935 RepID=UPI0003B96CA2|nr:hypothetical protein [Leptolyngbya sp. Heron Island J]ESA35253.1 hypothetical protein N836_12820 [Leptolyngbya sp. Heron Island J]